MRIDPIQTAPPALKPGTLRIVPLGGLGDVGRNMASFEIDNQLLLIDCGVLFPEDDHPGVDLILPALHQVTDRIDDVQGLVLTHGHEDHIGAVPYLLRNRPQLPVYGSRLTLALLESKLREHRIKSPDLRVVHEGDRIDIGAFNCEFVAVNHSIPDGLAVFVRTEGGSVLHTGDFKMDQLPLDGRITDLRAFARFGTEGVDLFMVDSTNAEVPGFTLSERETEPAIERVFLRTEGKLIVACFASHVHRVQQILDQAARHGRKVCYVGRSMVRNMGIASDLGYLNVPPGILIDRSDLDKYPDHQIAIISTGSQGEPLSALARMANRDHPEVQISPRDTVLLASSLIPGNETSIYKVINGLTSLGATVVHKANALVHVSGHASAGELLYCYNILKPRNVMPVHGEVRHLVANADLAVKTGVARDRVILTQDGGVVDLRDGVAKLVGAVDTSYIFVDGSVVGISDAELTDRKILGEEGFIQVVVAVDLAQRLIVSGPDITTRGFADDHDWAPIIEELRRALLEALADGVDDTHRLQQVMRRVVGRWVSRATRRRPMILPVAVAI